MIRWAYRLWQRLTWFECSGCHSYQPRARKCRVCRLKRGAKVEECQHGVLVGNTTWCAACDTVGLQVRS